MDGYEVARAFRADAALAGSVPRGARPGTRSRGSAAGARRPASTGTSRSRRAWRSSRSFLPLRQQSKRNACKGPTPCGANPLLCPSFPRRASKGSPYLEDCMKSMTLQEIADRIEIDDVLTRYATAVDSATGICMRAASPGRIHRLHLGRRHPGHAARGEAVAGRRDGLVSHEPARRRQSRRRDRRRHRHEPFLLLQSDGPARRGRRAHCCFSKVATTTTSSCALPTAGASRSASKNRPTRPASTASCSARHWKSDRPVLS